MAMKPHVGRTVATTHYSSRGGAAIDHIVIHYTTSRNIEGTIKHFVSGAPAVSAHYIVGQDGELVQMVDDAHAAWHATVMNNRSIGIEHVAADDDRITPKQEATSAALIRWLVATYNIPRANIIPHVAVKSTNCPGALFAAYGGALGASKAQQTAALNKWLEAVVFTDSPAPAEQKEVAMTETGPEPVQMGPTAPAPVHPEAQPASTSLTIWGAINMALALGVPVIATKIGVSTEAVWGFAGVVMAIIGRAATSPLKLR